MKRNANKVLESIRQSLAQHLPSGGRAVLFGSQARGDARPDSDWDILIVLDKEKLETADYDTVSYPLTTLGWDLGGPQATSLRFIKTLNKKELYWYEFK